MRKLELVAYNDATNFVHVVLYQFYPNIQVHQAQPVAWLVKPAFPGTRVIFRWREAYNFAWSMQEQLGSSAASEASQMMPADPLDPNANGARLLYTKGALHFGAARCQGPEGSLLLEQDDSVPAGIASVGIGMAGHSVLGMPTQPNIDLIVKANPAYYIAFSWKRQGEPLDLMESMNPTPLPFSDRVFRLAARLDTHNIWHVEPIAPATPDGTLPTGPGSA
ncbi:MAG: hypothetical protein ACM3XM_00990 [Mycobacterium leprae]